MPKAKTIGTLIKIWINKITSIEKANSGPPIFYYFLVLVLFEFMFEINNNIFKKYVKAVIIEHKKIDALTGKVGNRNEA